MRFFLTFSVFAFLGLMATPETASALGGAVQGNDCSGSQLGVTQASDDNAHLLACLYVSGADHRKVWKSMTPAVVTPADNVGIGTAAAQYPLDVGQVLTSGWNTGAVQSGGFIAKSFDGIYWGSSPTTGKNYQLIGHYSGWGDGIFIGGYNAGDATGSSAATNIHLGGWGPGSWPTMSVNLLSHAVGINQVGPNAALDVNGEIRVGSSGAACIPTNEGAMRYNASTKTVEFCNGSTWGSVGGGGGCYIDYGAGCLGGFTSMGSLGAYGACINSADPHHYRYSPPGAGCSLGVVGIGSWNFYSAGTARVCCK